MAWYRCVGGAGGSLKLRTASGRIATFSTNMVAPFKSLKSEINPVQDLHGYSKPWSGGGGKNKYNATINSLHTSWDNGIYTITSLPSSGFSWRMDYVTLPAGNYILNGGVSVNYRCFIQLGSDYYTSTGNDAPFTLTEETEISVIGVIMPAATVGQKMKPMIRLASVSDASFEPYSNICPISGFSALNVTRTGVNVWNEVMEQGAYSNSGTKVSWAGAMRSVDKFGIKPNTNYYFKFSGTSGLYICWYDATETIIERILITNSGVKQTPSNAYWCAFCTSNDYGTTYNNNISINYPSSDTEYHAYNGQTATVNFGQTVYGGVADVTGGTVTSTHKLVTYNGSENWQFISPSFYVATPIDCRVSQTPIANEYNGVAPTYYNVMVDGNIALSTVLDNLLVRNDSITSVADFKTALSNNPLTVLYELATPIEITTTPENLTAIVGVNNIFSDTNGDTEVKYLYRE